MRPSLHSPPGRGYLHAAHGGLEILTAAIEISELDYDSNHFTCTCEVSDYYLPYV